jgi:hypothetical protein
MESTGTTWRQQNTGELELERVTLRKLIYIANQMLVLSEDGDRSTCSETGRSLYGVVRDMAYRIRADAEKELAQRPPL